MYKYDFTSSIYGVILSLMAASLPNISTFIFWQTLQCGLFCRQISILGM